MEKELDLQKVGKFIAQLRNKKGLTQEQLADIIGTTFKTVSNWERGKNLPDITCQKKICDYFSITLYELLDGELNLVQRKKDKIKHINKIVLIILLCLLLPLFIFFSTYYFTHKDSTHVYQISNKENESNISIHGSLIKTYSYSVIGINSINVINNDIESTDIINVDLYSDDKLLYHKNNIEHFNFKYYKKDKINLNNIKLIINIKDINNKEYTFETNISYDDFNRSNNKIGSISFDSSTEVDENQIIKNLQKENFKNENEDLWVKEIKDKNSNIMVNVMTNERKINYVEETSSVLKNIIYYDKTNNLEVYIFHNDKKVHTLVEKYYYNYSDNKLDCQTGMCSTLDEVLKTMNKWIIRIFGE